MLNDDISSFVEAFIDIYYQERDLKALTAMLHPDICWTNMYLGNMAKGIGNVTQMLEKLFQEQLYRLKTREIRKNDFLLSEKDYFISYEAEFLSERGKITRPVLMFGSLRVVQEKEGFLLYEVSVSVSEKCRDARNPLQNEEKRWEVGESGDYSAGSLRLKQMNDERQILLNNLPGGIFRCLYNEELTILHMSDGFLAMFGYTRAEIKEIFHDSFWEMIDQRDREIIYAQVERQIKLGRTKQIEYRVRHKNGNSVWVLDKGQLIDNPNGGCPSFYCIMIDITQEKKMHRELDQMLERYDIIMSQTNDVIFEWDFQNDRLRYSRDLKKIIRQRIPEQGIHQFLFDNGRSIFYEEDFKKLKEMEDKIRYGVSYMEEELRLSCGSGQYQWWKLRLTVQFDAGGKAMRAIGVLINIDVEKSRMQSLLNQAQQDALTGIYNKMTAQTMIQEYLKGMQAEDSSILMIIDIDDFKNINDKMGHLFGDAVLNDVARRLKNIFDRDDVIGRIGGDEFIAFEKNAPDLLEARQKAGKIIEEMHEIKDCHGGEVDISCSIGIVAVPREGREFTTIFQKADQALYQAKNEGKNRYVVYDKELVAGYRLEEKNHSAVSENIDSNSNNKILKGQLAEYVFRVLYNARDMKRAVESILEIVGMQYDVSRVYIFENSRDGTCCSNTFEWCSEGVTPQIEKLKNIKYEDLGKNYAGNFDENGIFYCVDINTLQPQQREIMAQQEIKSVLQCAIKSNGDFRGFVGFDECRRNRYWTREQMEGLSFIAEILSVFLIKDQVENAYRQKSGELLEMLDNQSSWIYLIDPENCELLFVNKKVRQHFPDAEPGHYCYEALCGRKAPCEGCPAKYITKDCVNKRVEIENSCFGTWVAASTSRVRWKGREAVMLSCHDIAPYIRAGVSEDDGYHDMRGAFPKGADDFVCAEALQIDAMGVQDYGMNGTKK